MATEAAAEVRPAAEFGPLPEGAAVEVAPAETGFVAEPALQPDEPAALATDGAESVQSLNEPVAAAEDVAQPGPWPDERAAVEGTARSGPWPVESAGGAARSGAWPGESAGDVGALGPWPDERAAAAAETVAIEAVPGAEPVDDAVVTTDLFAEDLLGELLENPAAPPPPETPARKLRKGVARTMMIVGLALGLFVILYAVDLLSSAGDVPRG